MLRPGDCLPTFMPSLNPTPPLDFALLQQQLPGQASRSRRTLWWLLGLLLLVLASVVALVLYLNAFEHEEEERRRVSDGQWLEQSVRFHFLRLEEDLRVLARQALQPPDGGASATPTVATVQGGLLWSQSGAILWHGWQPHQDKLQHMPLPPGLQQARGANAWNDETLTSMLDITIGLRRSSYAGPMRDAQGKSTDTVWLAVPYFERGEFLGNYMAALSMQACIDGLVPAWFQQSHRVRLADDAALTHAPTPMPSGLAPHLAALNLPGTDLFIEITPLHVQPAMVPRLFLLVALTFLVGMLISLAALRRDMAKRQHVQALLQAQMVLRTAMENSVTTGMRAWTQNGQILYVNEAFCRMVGYSATELLGRRAPMPYWPSHLTEQMGVQHRDVIAHGTRREGIEAQFAHRDGHRVDVLIHEAPLTTASGEHVGWMSSVLDISEKKRAQRLAAQQQERLEASGRLVAVGEVASTLAHELNQPLGALSSFAHGLINRLHSRSIALEEIERVVQRMARLSDKAGGIIQRVNAFARRRELALAPVDLSHFVRRCLATHPHSGAEQVQWANMQAHVVVQADELLLEHVVNNLLANALAWSAHSTAPARVQVAVSADTQQQMARLAVADNGPGVAPEAREHIFNAFYSTHEGGMGMGLAICRSIIEAHHGRIEVDRDPLLGGARFTVWLPLTPPVQSYPEETP